MKEMWVPVDSNLFCTLARLFEMQDEKKQDAFKENGICTLGTGASISARIDGTDMKTKPAFLGPPKIHPKWC